MKSLIYFPLVAIALGALIVMPFGALAEDAGTSQKPADRILIKGSPEIKGPWGDGLDQSAKIKSLEAKKARINEQQAEIDRQAEPLGQQLNTVMADIEVHNQKFDDYERKVDDYHASGCGRTFTIPDEQAAYDACESRRVTLNQEAASLDQQAASLSSQYDSLVSTLQSYKNQWDELEYQKTQIQADIDKLIEFERRSSECEGLSDEAAYACMKRLWDGAQ